ncbi:MAG: hypothetical protein ACI4YB_00270 [Oscillospiraceae bacterium]
MNESLKKLLSVSTNGYIDDLEEAERIVSDLLGLTPAEIDPNEDSCILQNIEIYLDMLELTDLDKEAVTCGEFIGILDSFFYAPYSNDKEERLLVTKRSLYNLLGALRDNIGKNDTIKLFKAVTVESYFECISRKAGKRGFEVFELYQDLRYIFRRATGYRINKETKISDFFDEVFKHLNLRWDILSPIEEYKKMILTVYDAIYCFFIENLKIGFPEYFNRVEFIEKKADEDSSEGNIDDDLN